jgi:hypothetical protein
VIANLVTMRKQLLTPKSLRERDAAVAPKPQPTTLLLES